MKRITAIKLQSHNRQRVNVFLDGEFAFGLSKLAAAWLEVGQDISQEMIEELLAKDVDEVALQQALKFVGYRMRSRTEVQNNLKDHGYGAEIIQKTIARLERNGTLDDKRFAQLWVENRREYRPRSRRMLAFELRRKGISDGIIRETLDEIPDDEGDLAYQAATIHSRKMNLSEWQVFRKKMSDYLARRGFSYSVADSAVRRVWSERAPGTLPDKRNERKVSE